MEKKNEKIKREGTGGYDMAVEYITRNTKVLVRTESVLSDFPLIGKWILNRFQFYTIS